MSRARNVTVPDQGQKVGLRVSKDGYVRMPLTELFSLSLTHFLSGLDDDAAERKFNDVTQTTISGYTEWLSLGVPTITVGWDWCLDLTASVPRYVRDGWPRTNLMLVDAVTHQDLGDEATAINLARLIDQSEWACDTTKHIRMRYAWQHTAS